MTFEKWLQSRLTAHGFSVGPIDGIVGPVTTKALEAFERRHGLIIDGTADPVVVRALRAPASAVSPKDWSLIPDRDDDVADPDQLLNFPRQKDVVEFYGNVGTRQTKIEVPFDMVLAWDTRIKLKTMTLHQKVATSAKHALREIADTYSKKERESLGLHLFGGSLNVRKMRGGSRYSMHSWGIAIDFDPARNRLSWKQPVARLSHNDAVPFWEIWENRGWLSLGRSRNFDWMHVQAARL